MRMQFVLEIYEYTQKWQWQQDELTPFLFNYSYSFLNWWKTVKPMTLKFSGFQFCEKLSKIAWVDYFVLQIWWGWKEKQYFC